MSAFQPISTCDTDVDWISKLYKEFDFKRKKIGVAKDLPTKVDDGSSTYYIEG